MLAGFFRREINSLYCAVIASSQFNMFVSHPDFFHGVSPLGAPMTVKSLFSPRRAGIHAEISS